MQNSTSQLPLKQSIVLVGLMGAGKTRIGRSLAEDIGLPFVDADTEIEKAAGCSISDIFDRYGEGAFRDGERKVMQRLLEESPHVIATGGGAFMNDETRALIKEKALSIWLNAPVDVLHERTSRTNHRPLLQNGDSHAILSHLHEKRSPVYAQADIEIDSAAASVIKTVDAITKSIIKFYKD